MDIIDSKQDYQAPQAKVIEVIVNNSILDGSTGTGAATIGGYTEETLDW